MFFEVAFHGNVGVRLFIFSGFLFPFIISFYFIFCGTNVFFLGMPISNAVFTTCETVVCCLRFTPRFPRLPGIWMLGVQIWPVLERILSVVTTCWRIIVLEFGIPKLLPYSWIPEGRWGFESAWFWFFCIFIFQCSCFCLSYSLTVIWITPNWLLFVFCCSCPAPLCWIRNLN